MHNLPQAVRDEFKILMHHISNYNNLLADDLYRAHQNKQIQLNTDQLDYLMCMAIYYMPHHCLDTGLKNTELWLWYIKKIVNIPATAKDPQLEIIHNVVANRDKLDVLHNWHKSVLYTYRLVIAENLALVNASLQRMPELVETEDDPEEKCSLSMLFLYLTGERSFKDNKPNYKQRQTI